MSTDSYQSLLKEMTFHLYTRPLHPELFDSLSVRRIVREDFVLSIHITPTGHLLSWDTRWAHLTEYTGPADRTLPRRGQALKHRFLGEKTEGLRLANGIAYRMTSQLEFLPPEVFVNVHDELLVDGTLRGMLHIICPHHRFRLSPLAYVTVDSWQDCVSIATWHTFPEDCAIVRTQSLIERE